MKIFLFYMSILPLWNACLQHHEQCICQIKRCYFFINTFVAKLIMGEPPYGLRTTHGFIICLRTAYGLSLALLTMQRLTAKQVFSIFIFIKHIKFWYSLCEELPNSCKRHVSWWNLHIFLYMLRSSYKITVFFTYQSFANFLPKERGVHAHNWSA